MGMGPTLDVIYKVLRPPCSVPELFLLSSGSYPRKTYCWVLICAKWGAKLRTVNMKFITIAVTIFAVAMATTQAMPALHKRNDGSLVNVEDVKVPVYVKVEDVANDLARDTKVDVLRRSAADVHAEDADVVSKNA
ncbi:hypothetical protein EC968_002380 [Mortierella alpina]|nr:hypothetical protein EC968_002380 [Mortierella alpina]